MTEPPVRQVVSLGLSGLGSPEGAMHEWRSFDTPEQLPLIGQTVREVWYSDERLIVQFESGALQLTATREGIVCEFPPRQDELAPVEVAERLTLEYSSGVRSDWRRGELAASMGGRVLRQLTLSELDCIYLDFGPQPILTLMFTESLDRTRGAPMLCWHEEPDTWHEGDGAGG